MESIARISTLLESARELTIDAAQSARSSRSSQKSIPAAQIKKLLDSRHEREVLEGLRKVISMMYRSQPCLPYFSAVVKNVASPNLEIKKLVYIYLVNHAEAEPDLALLSINTIQKSLSDTNQQVRALALKTMSGIRVPVISQIVSLAIKKGLGDMSPLVRKTAALAIPKCYRLEPNTLPQLLEYISTLIGDKQYFVAGAAVRAFLDICPDRIDLIHKHYRGLVKKIVDMDEWGQLATLRLMTIYSRKCFPKRTRRIRKANRKGFYDDENVEAEDEEETEESVTFLDPDLEFLLKSIRPLLQSRNSAVVVAVIRCYVNLATPEYIETCVGPLVALLRAPQDIQQVALYNIVSVCMETPKAFVKYATHFLVRTTDILQICELKLEILTLIFPHCDAYVKSIILNELEHFSRGSDRDFVRESVRAIGRCAQSDPRTSARCLQLLLKQITSPDGNLVAESLTVIRHLIQQDPDAHTNTVIRLAKNLDTATSPQARATIIWLVGEFAGVGGENNIAPDVLRILAKGFADEAEAAKLQIILLAAKVYLHHLNFSGAGDTPLIKPAPPSNDYTTLHDEKDDSGGFTEFNTDPVANRPSSPDPEPEHPITLLWNHILLLARYDTSYDLRDRTRLYRTLLSVPSSTQLASLMLLAPKPIPHTPSPSENRKGLTLGSASLVIGIVEGGAYALKGYEALPEWVKEGEEPAAELREEESESGGWGEGSGRVVAAGERLDDMLRDQGISSSSSSFHQNNSNNASITANKTGMNGSAGANGKEKTLDDWLAEDEGNEEEEEEEEEENEEESDESDESDEEDEVSDEVEDSDDEGDENQALVK